MSLKLQLQKITEENVRIVGASLKDRLDSVTDAEFKSEALANIVNYPALNSLVHLVLEQALDDGLTVEKAAQQSVGASQAILVLTTLAEVRDLPPIQEQD